MDRNKRLKQQNKQRKEKIRKLFQNSVGVTASATAVVVATPLFDNVNADFNEFKLLEDSIYYELEVVEEVSEEGTPNARPLRLVIENQWERIEVDLEYGLNTDVLDDLRPNANYSFTVQMDKGVTWVTLASEQVATENELAGVIGPLTFTANEDVFDTALSVFTQNGGVDIQFYQLAIIQGDTTLRQFPVSEGDQTADITFPMTNESFRLELHAITATNELIVLDEKIVHPPAVFNASVAITLAGPSSVLVTPTLDLAAFETQTTRLDILSEGTLMDSLVLDGDPVVIDLEPSTVYQFNAITNYLDDRTDERAEYPIESLQLETPDALFYLLNVIEHPTSTELLLSVEAYDRWFDHAFIRTTDGDEVGQFSRVSTVGSQTLLRFDVDASLDLTDLIVGLTLNQPGNPELIIKGIGE